MKRSECLALPVYVAIFLTWLWVTPWGAASFQAEKSVALVLLSLYVLPLLPRRALLLLGSLGVFSLLVAGPAWRVALCGNDYRWFGVPVWLGAGVLAWGWSRSRAPSVRLAMVLASASSLSVALLVFARLFPTVFNGRLAVWLPAFVEGGTLGNRAFLSVALAPIVVYLAGWMWAAYRSRGWSREVLWWGGHWLIAIIGLALARSRGGWLGLAVAVIFVGGLLMRGAKRYAWWLGTTFLAGGGLAWGLTHPHSPLWNVIYRNGTLPQRLIVWKATLRLLLRHPLQAIVGFGADTLGLYFPTVYPSILMAYEPDGRAHVFDRAHNIILDVWVQFGLLGLVAGVALLGWIAHHWRHFPRPDSRRWGALGGWVALLSAWMVHFPTPSTLLLAGLLVAEIVRPAGVAPATVSFRQGGLFLAGGSVLLVGLILTASADIGLVAPISYLFLVLGGVWLYVTLGCGRIARRHALLGGYRLVVTVFLGAILLSDVFLGGAASMAGQGKRDVAILWGERAWRLCPRERIAWMEAYFWLHRHPEATVPDVQEALAWLERSPSPHSADWWFAYLDVMRAAYAVGLKSESDLAQAFAAARSYFPGNKEWEYSPP